MLVVNLRSRKFSFVLALIAAGFTFRLGLMRYPKGCGRRSSNITGTEPPIIRSTPYTVGRLRADARGLRKAI